MEWTSPLTSFEHHKTTAALGKAAEDGPNNPFTGEPLSQQYFNILQTRRNLPIHEQRDEFLQMFQKSQFLICIGETGCGKTTQIPQFVLLDDLPHLRNKMVACTEPRRIAAVSAAQRVAKEMDVTLGEEVGYRIRFEDKTSPKTILKYMTDGMLLREAMSDINLTCYSTFILDEAQERTMATDIIMALLKQVALRRPEVKVVIISTASDLQAFQRYFNDALLFTIRGRMYPIEIYYLADPAQDYVEIALRTVLQIHETEPEGDILLFLTGEKEINELCHRLTTVVEEITEINTGSLEVYPLYSFLAPDLQQRVFQPAPPPLKLGGKPSRKCIVSTNIAETSLTIDGIVYVIDPGFAKQKIYNPRTRIESLLASPISKASAGHRAGRAGRVRPGKCFRLYTEASYKKELNERSYPEILCSNLCATILRLKILGFDDIAHVELIDPPSPETIMRALEELNHLACLGDDGELTALGRLAAKFPLDPTLAVMLISSPRFSCSNEILSLVALLSVPPLFVHPTNKHKSADLKKRRFVHPDGDHLTMLNAYHAFKTLGDQCDPEEWCNDHFLSYHALQEADKARMQLKQIMERKELGLVSTPFDDEEYYKNIRRALVSGLFMQVAKSHGIGKTYTTVDNQDVLLHPSTTLNVNAEWVVYNENILTTKNYIRTVTPIEPEWLLQTAPVYYGMTNLGNREIWKALIEIEKKEKIFLSLLVENSISGQMPLPHQTP